MSVSLENVQARIHYSGIQDGKRPAPCRVCHNQANPVDDNESKRIWEEGVGNYKLKQG